MKPGLLGHLEPTSDARWFAVPCRECFPDAPPPGKWFSGHVLVQGTEVPTQASDDPNLAWQVSS